MGICCGLINTEKVQLLDSPTKVIHGNQNSLTNPNLNNDFSILVSSSADEVHYQVRYKGNNSNNK